MGAYRSNLVDRRILNLAINARNAMPNGGCKRWEKQTSARELRRSVYDYTA
jgi:hypothetical protein